MGVPLLVIQHEPDKGLGVLEAPLRQAGADLDIRFAGRDPLGISDHAGVIALPGTANPVDLTEAIDATRSSLRDALERELPILGICLGAELLAEAAGAKTFACDVQFGYWPVSLTPEATTDPVLAGLPAEFQAFQAHGYAAELPDEAITLAYSEGVLQGFRLGPHAWGVQFHPEPTEAMISNWIRQFGPVMERHGVNLEDLAAQARSDIPIWSDLGGGMVQRFVQIVRSVRR